MRSRLMDLESGLNWAQLVHKQLESAWESPACKASIGAIDLQESESGFKIVADVPGISAEDVELGFEKRKLTIKAKRKSNVPEGTKAWISERGEQVIDRSILLPCEIQDEAITASVNQGVLEVILPKSPKLIPRKIVVTS